MDRFGYLRLRPASVHRGFHIGAGDRRRIRVYLSCKLQQSQFRAGEQLRIEITLLQRANHFGLTRPASQVMRRDCRHSKGTRSAARDRWQSSPCAGDSSRLSPNKKFSAISNMPFSSAEFVAKHSTIPGRSVRPKRSRYCANSVRTSSLAVSSSTRGRFVEDGAARCRTGGSWFADSDEMAELITQNSFRAGMSLHSNLLIHELQRELHQAWRLRRKNVVECRRTDVAVRQPEIRVVQDIEQFRAELQLFRLRHFEILAAQRSPSWRNPGRRFTLRPSVPNCPALASGSSRWKALALSHGSTACGPLFGLPTRLGRWAENPVISGALPWAARRSNRRR